ncbi:MAG: glycosyltransferase family 4 protein [Roseovarius sp.]|nr:glycosyltransferase family 4 protein [Roseovarius sp.]
MAQAQPLKIAYLCDQSPEDRLSYSGGNARLVAALRDHVGDVTVLGSDWHAAQPARHLIEALPDSVTIRARWRAQLALGRMIARGVTDELRQGQYDVLFCAYSFQSLHRLRLPYPMVTAYTSDATPTTYKRSEVGKAFGSFLKVSRLIDPLILRAERQVFQATDLLFWPSEWLKAEADPLYGLDPARSLVVPWGANIADPGPSMTPPRLETGALLHLLVLGRDWFAKGGPVAFETMEQLRALGHDARLTVIGCTPPDSHRTAHVTVHAHLDKSKPDERATLDACFKSAHFMVMASFESYGFAFCEASAHGLPSLCLNVGGVPVREGVNGHAVAPGGDSVAAFTTLITGYLQDSTAYDRLRATSRQEYETRLNWQSWGKTVRARLIEARARLEKP